MGFSECRVSCAELKRDGQGEEGEQGCAGRSRGTSLGRDGAFDFDCSLCLTPPPLLAVLRVDQSCLMDPAVFDAELAKLRSKLRTLTKSDEHLEAMEAFDRLRASAPSRVKNIVHGAANQPTDKDVQEQAYRLSRTLQEGGVEEQTFRRYADLQNGKHTPKIATLPWMPCANVSAALVECKEKGKLVCSACGLVLYCSKVSSKE